MIDRLIIKNKFLYDYNFIQDPKQFNDLLLYQLGEIYFDENGICETHLHDDFFEFTFVVSGKGKIYANNTAIPVKKNDLFVSLPFENHKIVSDPDDPLRYYFIALSFTQNSKYKNDILYSPTFLSLTPQLRVQNSQSFANNFVSLLSTMQEQTMYSDLKFELMVKTFCINIWQAYQSLSFEKYSSPEGYEEQNLFYKIIHYIDDNLVKIDNLTEISVALHYNYIYLSRIFKSKSGQSIYRYFSEKKLLLAEQLIKENKMSITKISEYLNYSSIYVFSRSFKKYFGVSPNTYKANLKNGKKAKKGTPPPQSLTTHN